MPSIGEERGKVAQEGSGHKMSWCSVTRDAASEWWAAETWGVEPVLHALQPRRIHAVSHKSNIFPTSCRLVLVGANVPTCIIGLISTWHKLDHGIVVLCLPSLTYPANIRSASHCIASSTTQLLADGVQI